MQVIFHVKIQFCGHILYNVLLKYNLKKKNIKKASVRTPTIANHRLKRMLLDTDFIPQITERNTHFGQESGSNHVFYKYRFHQGICFLKPSTMQQKNN